MNAWIECPSCLGVLKISASQLEGPCPFCQTKLKVALSVVSMKASSNRLEPSGKRSPGHLVGRGPTPRLRPVISVKQ